VPLTLPSHASILSGLLPLHHGVRNNGAGSFPADRETLATLFSRSGYRTGAFVGAFVLERRFGLNRGFDVYDDDIPRDPTAGDRLEAERRGDQVVDRALSWLGTVDARPFFAWVHLYDAHAPYAAPEPFATRFASSPYDGEVAFVDQQVGRLLKALDDSGRRNDTLIVIVGDHGEALGEHGELTHGVLLYEPTLHVPLIVAAPGVLQPRVVNTRVSTVDLPPTVAALAGVPFPATPKQLDGRDLSAALKDGKEPAATDVYAETEYPVIFGWSGLASIARGPHKYISSSKPELYDLSRDPGETRNLFSDERRVMRALSASLTAFRATAAAPLHTNAPDAETMAKLASLGYVGGMPAARAAADRPSPAVMVPLFRRFEEATWAIAGKRLDEAAGILSDLVQRDPQNPVFRGSLAKVERQRGHPERAVDLYREAITDAPDDPEAWYNLAMAFQETGDVRRAGEAVREAIRRDARSPEAHNVLGIVYSGEGKPGEALAEFQRAIDIDPKNARAYNNMGNVLRATGRPGEAEAAFRKAVELAPGYPDPLNGLGAVQIDRDQPAQAIPYFDRALALAPDYLEARLSRAVARQISGDTPGAIADYRAFIDRSAKMPSFAEQRRVAASMLARLQSLQRGH